MLMQIIIFLLNWSVAIIIDEKDDEHTIKWIFILFEFFLIINIIYN